MATERFEVVVWQRPPANWAGVKRRLFELVRSSDAHAKRAAFLRLLKLNDLGVLSVSERHVLAQIFWGASHRLCLVYPWSPGSLQRLGSH